MAQRLRLNVDAVDDEIRDRGVNARIELQRDTTDAFGAPTNLPNVILVDGQEAYEVFDGAGSTGDWYRFRLNSALGTLPSAWSDAFRAGDVEAYATVEALRELLSLPDDSRDNLLADLLVRVTASITGSLGFDFFRHPTISGTEVRLFSGNHTRSIASTQGFAEVTQVRHTTTTGGTLNVVGTGNYYLAGPVVPGGPYLELSLTDRATPYRYWYYGHDTVEVTGVFGYLTIPPDVEQATLLWAADLYRIGVGGGTALGQPGIGLEEFGTPAFMQGRMPPFTYQVVEQYRKRHTGWLVA